MMTDVLVCYNLFQVTVSITFCWFSFFLIFFYTCWWKKIEINLWQKFKDFCSTRSLFMFRELTEIKVDFLWGFIMGNVDISFIQLKFLRLLSRFLNIFTWVPYIKQKVKLETETWDRVWQRHGFQSIGEVKAWCSRKCLSSF